MKCICYLRQSSGENDPNDSLSIQVQEEECRKLAISKGYEIIKVIPEPNCSGRLYPSGYESLAAIDTVYQKFVKETGKKNFRKGLGEIMNRLDEIDCIVVIDITRLFRPLTGSFLENLVLQKLVDHNVKVLSVKEGILDFSSFQTQLVNSLTSSINSSQLTLQREKSKAGLRKLKESGEWNSQCSSSFGYRGTGRKREVEIVPNRAEAVKLIYKLFLEGKRYFTIARAVAPLLEDDPKSQVLYKPHMLRILRNPIYCGYYALDDGSLIKSKTMEGKELISYADWQKVQEMLDSHKTMNTGARKNFLPLSGKFECGYCGSKINAVTTNRTNVHMRCIKHWFRNRESCRCGITWKTIEAGGAGLLDALYPLSMIWLLGRIQTNDEASASAAEKIQTQIYNVDKKISQLQTMWLEDSIAPEAFKSSMKMLNDKRKELSKQLESIRQNAELESSSIGELQTMLKKCFAHTMTEGECELALRSTIEKVIIFRDKVEVMLTTGDKFELPVKKITKSKELPLPWIDVEEKNDKPHYRICYSFKRLSPELKKKMKTICSFPELRLDICLG